MILHTYALGMKQSYDEGGETHIQQRWLASELVAEGKHGCQQGSPGFHGAPQMAGPCSDQDAVAALQG